MLSNSHRLLVGIALAVLVTQAAAGQSSLSHPASARQPASSAPPAAVINRIERAVSTAMSQGHIPGLSTAIVTDRQLRWSNGYGMADLENFVPAKAATVYRLGSISKPITATAIMQLVEQGKLDLDAPVQKYCSAFPPKRWPVTSRELLGHLGGVRHYTQKEEEAEYTSHFTSVADGLAIFKDDPLLAEPGTEFRYSSFGYNLLGCVVEGASGQPFAAYLHEHIFVPAGMDHIQPDDVFQIISNRARGYALRPDGLVRNSDLMDSSYKIPSGGLSSTVIDLARFAIAIQSGVLLKPETVSQMFTSQKTRDGKATGYGLGWGVEDNAGVKAVSHSGGQSGTSTDLLMRPDRGLAVVVMCNLEGAHVSALARALAQIVLQPEGSGATKPN
ncbi:MAG TPA: serine hydrolase domain-containing protein [Terriglobia bacterium]|nr:serine hydrolase domain-containing protein [Terriglobia bacterium]